jgi:uncharacterized Zn-binding protein involved in type VI secretion
MRSPAARIKDSHACPVTTPVPHIGGKIIGKGIPGVLIEGEKAAVLDDKCMCVGRFNRIITGSTSVFIGGRPAARQGDWCAHGGRISSGSNTVLIGGTLPGNLENELADAIQWFLQQEIDIEATGNCRPPSPARRAIILKQTLQDAIGLLSKKLKLFKKRDAEMMEQFKKWFGKDDARSIEIIFQRIKRELTFIKQLNETRFWNIMDKELKESEFALIRQWGDMYIIYVDDLFWQAGRYGKNSKAGILIHELSHCRHIGKTEDHAYEEFGCLSLALHLPGKALENADNYEFFIES